jgi:hypothetical protein
MTCGSGAPPHHRFALASALLAAALLGACGSSGGGGEAQRAIAAAKRAYAQADKRGIDLTQGPCIAERLPGLPDWVADVAHDPRKPVDDQPRNQCQRFRTGTAHHFVELTPGGRVIRAE